MRAITPEDYLLQLRHIDKRIVAIDVTKKRVQEIRDIEKAQELQKQLDQEEEQRTELVLRLTDEIRQLPDNRLSTLLISYYVNNLTWEDTAKAIGINDAKWVRTRLKEKALKLFAAYYPKYFL
ncbi:MAG: hypothetical protein J6Y64_08335 [Ruminococcus sp.]|nr:hypothetical protein [Ruminococcus sp.]